VDTVKLFIDGDQRFTATKVREMFSSLVQLHFICHSKTPSARDSEETSLDIAVSSHSSTVSGEIDSFCLTVMSYLSNRL